MEQGNDLFWKMRTRLDEYLMSHQMRKTPERYEVLRTVCLLPDIFSLPELAKKMQEEADFQVSRTTLFNTLETLVEAQLLIRHALGHGAQYELRSNSVARTYLVCQDCGSIRRLDRPELTKYLSSLKARLFSVQQPILYLHGQCKKCIQARRKKQGIKVRNQK